MYHIFVEHEIGRNLPAIHIFSIAKSAKFLRDSSPAFIPPPARRDSLVRSALLAHEALAEAAVGVPQSTVSPDLKGNLRDETADGREPLDPSTVGAGPRPHGHHARSASRARPRILRNFTLFSLQIPGIARKESSDTPFFLFLEANGFTP